MDRKSWVGLLEILEADPRLRQELESAALQGEDQLVLAFQTLGARLGETPSRADIAALRGAAARVQRTAARELADEELERVSGGTGEDDQLANVNLDNILQKQQQTLQMMSNISKLLYDTTQSTIRKQGG